MRTFHSLRLLAASVAASTLCSAMPRDARAPWQPTWEEPAAPALGYGVDVGSPALPVRTLDEDSRKTCPKDTVACHLPRNWNCCPAGMPCCGPGCCAEGFGCVDARVGVCCREGTTLCGGVCVRGEGCCGPTGACGDGTVCCGGRCARRCGGGGGVVVWGSAAAVKAGVSAWGGGWYAVVLLGTALVNAV
ncbi:hypothetical protein LZ30DRAFT_783984 [Colletotrichum cereale]|nr:hypothetical protein LZ30DRAFT_783984 [Colletotrichum cereale]